MEITYNRGAYGNLGNISDMGTKFRAAQDEINQVFHALQQVWNSQARAALDAAQRRIDDELVELMNQFMRAQDSAVEKHDHMHRTDGMMADGFGG